MDALYNTHVKLLAFDFLKLTPSPTDPSSFFRRGKRLSRAETVGIVVTRDLKPGKFVKFTIDDGSGCISCVLWLNQLNSSYFSRRNPSDVRLIAQAATDFASDLQLGVLARVRGRITDYRGALQISVSDVVVERDPNMQILHWLDCMRSLVMLLARILDSDCSASCARICGVER
ncbi:CST complex subunit STN1-like [Coffea arabica]|uniref:CST complex subunit STN1 n=1 Tax=Coffea arabica TaxID=13443 RepID=A0A6P6WJF3_COFAR|nr:CST complex subunit STN1-like isoform X1 [Coffea arabica]XP_027115355.1 CST complex subunit STN1-like isoform X1 [Coffea arabica]